LTSALLQLDHWAFVLCLALYCVLGSSYFWILAAYLHNRRRGEAAEAEMLALPLPPDGALPPVLIQLPTFNEGFLILRVAEAVAELDWPPEKLHVQILDDSTDGSFAHCERAASRLRQKAIDAVAIHRNERRGFKAGALAQGFACSDEPFVAVLDADYMPRSDFLKNCMRPLLRDEKLALVQARCDYLNGQENLITRTQQRILDAHYLLEQAARCWSDQIVPFNGTCGIWRRVAVDNAGGWHGDTLAEDMDLSYRVQINGWRCLFLASVTVPGELPRDLKTWQRQQFRWTKGSAEVTRKLLAAVWRAPLRLDQKLVSTLHLGGGLFGFVFGLTLGTGLVDLAVGQGPTTLSLVLLIWLAIEGIGGPALLELVGQKFARGATFLSELRLLPQVTALRLGVSLANVGGAAEALFGHGSEFVRTPKEGVAAKAADDASLERYVR
jgi:cellulose synthase/poly-beta-1,6-N-acetylglucosamine synthase-like glycosyltransferase